MTTVRLDDHISCVCLAGCARDVKPWSPTEVNVLVLVGCMQSCLSKLLLFGKVDFGGQRRIAAEMYERTVMAGEILIKEGDTGLPQLFSSAFHPLMDQSASSNHIYIKRGQ